MLDGETKAYPGSLAWVPNICSSLKGFLTRPCKADLTGPAFPLLAVAVLNPTFPSRAQGFRSKGTTLCTRQVSGHCESELLLAPFLLVQQF